MKNDNKQNEALSQTCVSKSAFNPQKISDKTFQLAKNIGFDLKTCNCGGYPECICYEEKPTQTVLQKWLREVKKVAVDVYCELGYDDFIYSCDAIAFFDLQEDCASLHFGRFESYEDALENGMIQVIKVISTQTTS